MNEFLKANANSIDLYLYLRHKKTKLNVNTDSLCVRENYARKLMIKGNDPRSKKELLTVMFKMFSKECDYLKHLKESDFEVICG